MPGRKSAQVDAHQKRDRNRHRDGECSPGAGLEGVDHDERAHAEQDDHDADDGDVRDEAAEAADFGFGHFGEGFAVAANGEQQDHEILHAAAEDRARENPESAGKIAELCGEDGADQRAGAGDGGEVMSEDDPLVGAHEVAAILEALGGSGAQGVE